MKEGHRNYTFFGAKTSGQLAVSTTAEKKTRGQCYKTFLVSLSKPVQSDGHL
jgi:hypothetical protein